MPKFNLSNQKYKKAITDIAFIALILAFVLGGSFVFGSRRYAFIIACVTLLTLALAFFSFEKKDSDSTRYLVLVATMTALSVAGRLAFYPVAYFKPLAAMVIICGLYIDRRAAFICGSLSALISGFFFGLGAWVPFQMLAWGLIGYISGLLSSPLKKSKLFLLFYAIITAIFYSAVLDIFTVLQYDEIFNIKLYFATLINALPVMVVYIVSNIVFLFALSGFMGRKICHMRTKFGF